VFSDDEIRRLFHAIDSQPLSEMSNRALVDPVLFRVFYATGMFSGGRGVLQKR
jgi:integrase